MKISFTVSLNKYIIKEVYQNSKEDIEKISTGPLAKDEQESIKALICGDTFMPKLLENVTKSDGGLTDDGATLILASLKYGE